MSCSDSGDQGFHSDEPAFQLLDYTYQCTPNDQKCPKNKIEQPIEVISKSYSLEPDMMFGWTPKIPSLPMPLDYGNNLDQLKRILNSDQRYKIAYLQDQSNYNTVKVHQKYSYKWKQRSKYDLKIGFIQEAVQKIGQKQNFLNYQMEKCQFEFNSNFQSGNLALSVRIRSNEYDLYLRNDSNTKGHTNWYYFQVSNLQNVGIVQFNICNLKKTKNLYGKGMQPFIMQTQHSEWKQGLCNQVNFVQRYCRHREQTKIHQLQFKYRFHSPNMNVKFAYCIPYTYSKLQKFVTNLHSQYLTIQNLGYSFASLQIPLLKITDDAVPANSKKAYIIVGRTHPGQSNSSFVVEGLISELLSKREQASYLRKCYTFYIIPMLNVDGTILGNFRCGAKGYDLNRQFIKGNQQIEEVNAIQSLIQKIKRKGQKIQFFLDFHGHSSKTNFFAYGPEHNSKSAYFTKCYVFLKLIAEKTDNFKTSQCTFTIPKYKKHTARSYMLKQQNIPMCFTFQISNGIINSQKIIYYNQFKFIQAGVSLMKGLYEYRKGQDHLQNLLKAKKEGFFINKSNLIKRGSLNIQRQSLQNTFSKLQRRNSFNNLQNKTQKTRQIIRQDKIKTILKQICKNNSKNQARQEPESDMESIEDDYTQKEKKIFYQNIQMWKQKFMHPKLTDTQGSALKTQNPLKIAKTAKEYFLQTEEFTHNLMKQSIIKTKHKILGHNRSLRKSSSNLLLNRMNATQILRPSQPIEIKSKRKAINLKSYGKHQIGYLNSTFQSPSILKPSSNQKWHKQMIIESFQVQKQKSQFKMPLRLQKKSMQSATILLRSKRFPLDNMGIQFMRENHS